MSTIEFDVFGHPVQQGNMTAVGSKVFEKKASGLALWRQAVMLAAEEHWPQGPVRNEAFTVTLDFYFRRPAGHHGKKGVLPSAPAFHVKRPDVDKLTRSILDALTGVVWHDDSQVVAVTSAKDFREREGCHVAINCLGDIKHGA